MPLSHSASHPATPVFWRDAQLPFIEARSIADGRKVCYARHSHDIFSIGAITAGRSTYLHEKSRQTIDTGTVVLMNPGDVHACNPIDDQPWSYVMFYVDPHWLGRVQETCGVEGFQPVPAISSQDPALFDGLLRLHRALLDPALDALAKQKQAVGFFTLLQQRLGGSDAPLKKANERVERAARYINEHFLQAIRLQDICQAANLSEAYLIRAFEQHYHMTPHAYVINRRIQHAQARLREGEAIADIAHQSGFSDQAHFQRAFKKHLATTPGQYRR
ncbi:AraC family transcriptional regulator [Pseudomonas sp. GD03842]|uniref:helix-turn-helix transcriptional regulator n=1 Tax=Pseudomonas sp. GD03842 TaxID=2975385 RepID=UPI002448ACFD|nr:AraC family transcriptional regulator [Pseudomonas sp. GD03842]MDH0748639.1 AraC family transcriptional regulator [Pseudomonas sp. GD03842]